MNTPCQKASQAPTASEEGRVHIPGKPYVPLSQMTPGQYSGAVPYSAALSVRPQDMQPSLTRGRLVNPHYLVLTHWRSPEAFTGPHPLPLELGAQAPEAHLGCSQHPHSCWLVSWGSMPANPSALHLQLPWVRGCCVCHQPSLPPPCPELDAPNKESPWGAKGHLPFGGGGCRGCWSPGKRR